MATIETATKRLDLFVRFLESNGPLPEIQAVTPFHILSYQESLKARGSSPATCRSRFLTLRAFFSWAIQWEMITVSPAAKLKPPKVPKTRKPFLTAEAFEQLLAVCADGTWIGNRRTAMLQMFATTGMRLAELVALRLDDLNWADGIIRIRLGKGQKERWVPFATKAQRAVYRYLKGRRQNGPHPELWISTHGGSPLSYSAVATEMQRLFRSAGLGLHDRCHIFRRTWAAGTVRQGIPRQYAQVAAGWTTTRMLDHYTAAMMDDEEAIEALRDFDPFAPRRTDF